MLGAGWTKYGVQGLQKLGRAGTENMQGGVIFGRQRKTSSTKVLKRMDGHKEDRRTKMRTRVN